MKIVWLQIEGEISQPWEKPTKTGTKVKVKRRSSNRDRALTVVLCHAVF